MTGWVSAAVLAHALVTILHGMAHTRLGIDLSAAASAFVIGVIVVGPIAGLAVFWSGWRRAGAGIVAATMAGALVFGLWKHFVAESGDNVSHLPAAAWALPFQITAWLLALTEAAGAALGVAAAWRTR